MKPETEFVIRQLAGMILADDGRPHRVDDAAGGDVLLHVEMRGMMHTIRREIMCDHASMAAKVADEIERATGAINLDALIKEEVARAVAAAQREVRQTITDAVRATIARGIEHAVAHATKGIADRACRAVIDAAFKSENDP